MRPDPIDAQAVDDELRHAADRFLGTLLEVPLAGRPALLAALQADDPPLYALVASLMLNGEALDGFVEASVVARPEDRADDFVGRIFGHWRIVRPLAHGGTGIVFEVERADGIVRQRAALKLLKRTLDDASIVARFRIERQVLASLEHPNIARLIDAGASPEGRPFLVMEYVDGEPLDRWCDARGLSIAARIALFDGICGAVQYAHQRLVVHRDLKPSNILVTADGVPKLLDFGVAKLLAPDPDRLPTGRTDTADVGARLTPRYASPEQLVGKTISTTSDVYSLGVILFESLTGRSPYRLKDDSFLEVARAVGTTQPLVPSAVLKDSVPDAPTRDRMPAGRRMSARLRADLDAIVLKALARVPTARYESAAALRDDLARFLAGDPVRAVAPTWRYRAGKFARRHAIGVGSAAVATLAIVALAAIAMHQAIVAGRSRDATAASLQAAEHRFQETRSLARTVLFELDGEIGKGPTQAREKLVTTALQYLDRLSQERLEPDLLRDVAAGYVAIAAMLGNRSTNDVGRTAGAQDALLKALALRQRLVDQDPDDIANLRGLRVVETDLGHLLRLSRRPGDAALHFANATREARRIAAQDGATPDDTLDLLSRRHDEASILFSPGRPSLHRYDDALARYRDLLAEIDAFMVAHPDSEHGLRLQEVVLSDLATLERLGGDPEAALAHSLRDLAIINVSLAQAPEDPNHRRSFAVATGHVGDSLLELGRTDEGFAMLERSMQIRQQLFAADPSDTGAARDLAIGHSILGFAADLARRPREALTHDEQWVRLAEAALKKEPGDDGRRLDLARARWSTAEQLFALGESRRALSQATEVVASLLAKDGESQPTEEGREALGRARLVQARVLAREGRTAEASSVARRGLANLEENARLVPEDAFASRDFARAQIDTGMIGLAARLDTGRACGSIRAGRERLASLAARQRLSAQFAPLLAEANAAQARCANR